MSNYSDYTIYVDKYAGQIGEKYLFKHDDSHRVFGQLSNSYEQQFLFNSTRTHDIKIEDAMGQDVINEGCNIGTFVSEYGTMEVDGDEYIIYRK